MTLLHHFDTKHLYLTDSGMEELQEQLEELKHARAKIVDEIRDLTSQSSASSALEDSARTLHQDRIVEIEDQITLIERCIRTAKIIEKPQSTNKIAIGSQVTLNIGGTQQTYTIVGSIEADPDKGKVSNESPLGRSLLGKKVNDNFEIPSLTPQRFVGTVVAIE